MDMDEKKLIERAKKDPEAFGQLFEKYYSPLLHYVLKRVGNVQIAEDISSQIFYIVLTKLWQFRWRNIPFSAWLYRIANNEINYYFRTCKFRSIPLEILLKEHKWEPIDSHNFVEEIKEAQKTLEEHRDFLLIQKKILSLPIKYQEVLSLKYLEGKKIREISLILGKNENTIKSLLKRSLALLQQKIHRHQKVQPISSPIISEYEQS
jgi:RNA polymerase sigma-70 factor (ECF subfamily)